MGTERLRSAERAAGFAMVANEAEDAVKLDEKADGHAWRAGEAMLVEEVDAERVKAPASMTDWVKGVVFGVLGRGGAPA